MRYIMVLVKLLQTRKIDYLPVGSCLHSNIWFTERVKKEETESDFFRFFQLNAAPFFSQSFLSAFVGLLKISRYSKPANIFVNIFP